ncbi:MAG TPA: FAD-binding oxidoreductase [Actinomycetes bacterium]|nr:FAD-binding oxidoreductase [Actinomycetes bacterium]
MAATANTRNVIGEATLGELEATLRGQLVRPTDPDYDQARAVWNAAHDRRPALIVRCAAAADVIRAVEFARSEGLQLAVRGGAHSIAGFSTSDGGVVIDLSPMKGIRVDPAGRRAVAQPGVTWSELDHETQAFGLAVTGGLVSSTGIAGFTLGGGIGWLLRKHGLTCDNLLSADVVTADGQLITTREHEHPELFWALRGGGGNFGVVTSLEYRLHPVGPTVFAGPVFYAAADAAQVLRGWRDLTTTMPDELTTLANILVAPPVPFLPEAVHGQMVVGILGVYAGSVEDGTRAAQPLRTLANPIADLMGPMPYAAMQGLLDPLWTAGAQNYFTGTMLGGLSDEAIETLLARHAAGRAPVHELHLHHGGGAMANAPAGGTAFAHRDAAYILNIIARSPDREGFDTHAGWAREAHRAMDPWSTGGYVNFTSEPGQDKVQASYPPDTYARLVAVKDRYDPANLFQLNQNIRPSGHR